ncbi:hypothetical protein SAMN04487783_1332 [Agrococcus baldri]|uniref:Uncharacterized protein n=1 Tax=Agrococcus baldri TaxID=153730 RepID=A0AA94HM43_9MICO|nr:hypothetical protein [Agrococcus baldri]SFS09920.1 hypothetical protein SAMN04487783_1332 [Agrococcus baldri]
MSDPHVLGEGLAPTPFTADEIRAGCPDGHWLLVRTERAGVETFHRNGFEEGDEAGCTLTSVETDASGRPTWDVSRQRATWLDLQAHAAFPAERTTVAPERIRLAFGERECLRYEVTGDGGTTTFWFALDHPGMPVRRGSGDGVAEVVALAGA